MIDFILIVLFIPFFVLAHILYIAFIGGLVWLGALLNGLGFYFLYEMFVEYIRLDKPYSHYSSTIYLTFAAFFGGIVSLVLAYKIIIMTVDFVVYLLAHPANTTGL